VYSIQCGDDVSNTASWTSRRRACLLTQSRRQRSQLTDSSGQITDEMTFCIDEVT